MSNVDFALFHTTYPCWLLLEYAFVSSSLVFVIVIAMVVYVWMCNPPGSAPSHRAGLKPGTLAWEAGALPSTLKAPLALVARTPLFEIRGVRFYTQQPVLAYIRYRCRDFFLLSLSLEICDRTYSVYILWSSSTQPVL